VCYSGYLHYIKANEDTVSLVSLLKIFAKGYLAYLKNTVPRSGTKRNIQDIGEGKRTEAHLHIQGAGEARASEGSVGVKE
jgi:hypothetical protein